LRYFSYLSDGQSKSTVVISHRVKTILQNWNAPILQHSSSPSRCNLEKVLDMGTTRPGQGGCCGTPGKTKTMSTKLQVLRMEKCKPMLL
jgi:hypothetical protein